MTGDSCHRLHLFESTDLPLVFNTVIFLAFVQAHASASPALQCFFLVLLLLKRT